MGKGRTKAMKQVIRFVSIVMVFGMTAITPALAGTATQTHQATDVVPTFLSITADVTDFTLTFADFASGSLTDTQVVNYTVRFNGATVTDGAVKAKISEAYTNVDLKADVGAYTKTAGNARLTEQSAGYMTIGTTDVNIAKRVTDTGSGKTSRGSLAVTYQAEATNVLEPVSEAKTLTITLADA